MSLATLRTRVRDYLDESSAAFWTDARLNAWINDAYEYYYLQMVQAFEGDFSPTPVNLDVVSGTEAYALPTDFLKAIRVERVFSTYTIPLRYLIRNEAPNITANANFSTLYLPTYYFRGTNLVLEPTPNLSITAGVRIYYVPTPVRMILDTDDVAANFVGAYQNCIILRAAVSAKVQEEMIGREGVDPSGLLGMLSEWEQILKDSIEEKTTARQYTQGWGLEDGTYLYF